MRSKNKIWDRIYDIVFYGIPILIFIMAVRDLGIWRVLLILSLFVVVIVIRLVRKRNERVTKEWE